MKLPVFKEREVCHLGPYRLVSIKPLNKYEEARRRDLEGLFPEEWDLFGMPGGWRATRSKLRLIAVDNHWAINFITETFKYNTAKEKHHDED